MTDEVDCNWNGISAAKLHDLADQFGTPYFCYDADEVEARIRGVRDSFGGMVGVFYAVKANPNLELLRALRGVADGLDISSGGELEQAILAGYDAAEISFAGPAKTRTELGAAIARGVGCVSVESLRELNDCVDIARRSAVAANVTVRVNPRLLNKSFGLKMGGRPTQFGIDEEELPETMQKIDAAGSLVRFRGLHVYAGSQCFDVQGVVDEVTNILRMVQQIEVDFPNLYCSSINLGGGFGAAHAAGGRELDVVLLAQQLSPALQDFRRASSRPRRIFFELGRYLTSTAGVYVARVISIKRSRGKQFVVVDGGLHHHLAAAGTFGAALRANYPVRNLSRPQATPIECSIAGPSCNPTDLLGIDVKIPQPELGDLIAVMGSGSYGLTASPILFLGRRTPAELVRRGDSIALGRRARDMVEFN